MVALARETRLSEARTRKQRGVTYVKGVADRMIDDAVGDGDGALRSLLFKIALVTPLPLVFSYRIIGFKWAEDNMSGGSLQLSPFCWAFSSPFVRSRLSSFWGMASRNCESVSRYGMAGSSSQVCATAWPSSSSSWE